jgi:hypothetical protein
MLTLKGLKLPSHGWLNETQIIYPIKHNKP